MYNYEYEVEVEYEEPEVEYEYEVEYEDDYQPYEQTWEYGGGHGGNQHFQNEVEFEFETPMDTWGNSGSWGQRNNDWMVPWKGWYKQGGSKVNMHFQNFQVDANGSIWGHGSDQVGTFNISGKMNWSSTGFKFVKQYVGQHAVTYNGKIQGNGDVWAGRWYINQNGDGGNFQLRHDAPRWRGAFWQQGQKNNMQLDMSVTQQGVFGTGHDQVGRFVIRGDVNGNQVHFAKSYVGQHTVLYNGWLQGFNDIRGQWQIQSTGQQGKFHLHT